MSLNEVRNVVLLLSNPYTGGQVVPSTIVADVTELSPDINDATSLAGNITTLSMTSTPAQDGAVIQGLLYVPDLDANDPCQQLIPDYVPSNVTRRNDLPPMNYNLIALVPWISPSCTESYLTVVRRNPIRAMLVYLPSNNVSQPPPASDSIWALPSGDGWKTQNRHPVYAVPGAWGSAMMTQLSLYSGNLTEIPYGDNITAALNPNPEDYVRVWTQLTVGRPEDSLDLWVFMLIVIGLVTFIIGCTTIGMRWVRRCRRESLRQRVLGGDVNLEAQGIMRLRVPLDHVQSFPLYLYDFENTGLSKTLSKIASRSERPSYKDYESLLGYQPCCQICIENFVSKKTVIRELSCGHIFHPECIDDYLSEISSLCPVCKCSMLPQGFCPKITDNMVRREFASRKAHALVIPDPKLSSSVSRGARSRSRMNSLFSSPTILSDPISQASTAVGKPPGY
ncbi:uncharacterized protein B0I36DRAFT_138228 [Microdochium trichocladiopsis]|uniref:RING-type domain-containing protein n=1 Tax=Microdochium trichocladiopsis TaxID=1682393 RepID=A0A9P8Y2S0_9PEZI|nr:uncharacterized protein B0I36DRAFT_138228 [Microdochium trichocladiopsis]KAH7027404.1 hypothetical protein B0I36DRAFT_138228 [Microdochium trichocladiopsis]